MRGQIEEKEMREIAELNLEVIAFTTCNQQFLPQVWLSFWILLKSYGTVYHHRRRNTCKCSSKHVVVKMTFLPAVFGRIRWDRSETGNRPVPGGVALRMLSGDASGCPIRTTEYDGYIHGSYREKRPMLSESTFDLSNANCKIDLSHLCFWILRQITS